MKIITEKEIYVQKGDILFLDMQGIKAPASISSKIDFKLNQNMSDKEKREFVSFYTLEEINFFKRIDWILDYDSVKNLSEQEIIDKTQSVNEMLSANKSKKENEMIDYQVYALRDYLWSVQGLIYIDLPDCIKKDTEIIEEKGMKKLVKSLFKKNK